MDGINRGVSFKNKKIDLPDFSLVNYKMGLDF